MKEFSVQSMTMYSLSHSYLTFANTVHSFLNVNLLKIKSFYFFMNLFMGQEVIFLTSSQSAYKIIGCRLLYHVHMYIHVEQFNSYGLIIWNNPSLSEVNVRNSCELGWYIIKSSETSFQLQGIWKLDQPNHYTQVNFLTLLFIYSRIIITRFMAVTMSF